MSQVKDIDFRKLDEYKDQYSEKGLFDLFMEYAAKIGAPVVYKALQLFYVLKKPDVPAGVKGVIVGALAYLICPVDLIPDFIPVVGWTDDAGVIVGALAYVSAYVDDGVREQARRTMLRFFSEETVANL